MGGVVGWMIFDIFCVKNEDMCYLLLVVGVVGGFVVVFNVFFVGIMFVIEEM